MSKKPDADGYEAAIEDWSGPATRAEWDALESDVVLEAPASSMLREAESTGRQTTLH